MKQKTATLLILTAGSLRVLMGLLLTGLYLLAVQKTPSMEQAAEAGA